MEWISRFCTLQRVEYLGITTIIADNLGRVVWMHFLLLCCNARCVAVWVAGPFEDWKVAAKSLSMGLANIITTGLLLTLQVYFFVMTVTVERNYCHGALSAEDTRLLMKETWDFCSQHNKLFLSRPDWMRYATCVSSYVFSLGYLTVFFTAFTNSWRRLAVPLLLFVGAKAYAIGFYHLMEFANPTLAPEASSLLPYFAVEAPYLLSMGMVIHKVATALGDHPLKDAKVKAN